MAFANTDSIVANDINNMLRGLHRNNADSSHTGDTNQTALSSFTMTGGTMGSTGRVVIEVAGTVTGAAGAKRILLEFGSGNSTWNSGNITGTSDWFARVIVSNTATNAQRTTIEASSHDAATMNVVDTVTSSEDTTANVTIRVLVTLADGADAVTQTKFEVQVQQIS